MTLNEALNLAQYLIDHGYSTKPLSVLAQELIDKCEKKCYKGS